MRHKPLRQQSMGNLDVSRTRLSKTGLKIVASLIGALAALRCVRGAIGWAILIVSPRGIAGAATVMVQVAPFGDTSFSPGSVSIKPGDTVQWVWKSKSMPHSVTSSNGLFDSGVQQSNTFTFSHTFPIAGTFPYFCTVHAQFMKGTVTVAAAASSKLSNISTRALVQTGNNVLISGFIISGSGNKSILLRALGPTLSSFGVSNALPNPVLQLNNGAGAVIATNDNWGTAANAQSIPANLRPPNSLESAILTSLGAGNYTAVVSGVNSTTGVALAEAYDLDTTTGAILSNISTRGFVDTGNQVMIGGFIIQGSATQKVLVRGLGPTLTGFGVSGALADPTLELRDANGNLIDSNDNWKSTNQTAIMATGLQPPNDLESAILRILNAGNYTAIVRGVNSTTGVALVDVYALH
jgi:plastocyanin